MLTVLVAAASHNLTTKEAVKLDLGITSSTNDALIDRLIAEASSIICGFCRRATFSREGLRQTEMLFKDVDAILLDREYEIDISLVTENGVTVPSAEYELDGIILYRLDASGYRSCWKSNTRVLIEYEAGYALLGNLPWSIESACLKMTKSLYTNRASDGQLRSERVLDIIEQTWAVDKVSSSSGLTLDVEGMLSPFIKEVVV